MSVLRAIPASAFIYRIPRDRVTKADLNSPWYYPYDDDDLTEEATANIGMFAEKKVPDWKAYVSRSDRLEEGTALLIVVKVSKAFSFQKLRHVHTVEIDSIIYQLECGEHIRVRNDSPSRFFRLCVATFENYLDISGPCKWAAQDSPHKGDLPSVRRSFWGLGVGYDGTLIWEKTTGMPRPGYTLNPEFLNEMYMLYNIE